MNTSMKLLISIKALIIWAVLLWLGITSSQAQYTQKQKLVAGDRGAFDFFSSAIALSGNRAIIGAENNNFDASGGNLVQDAGAAYIVELENGQWVQKAKLVANDRGQQHYFGRAAGISGNYAVVGAFWCNTDATGANPIEHAGAAYIFELENGQWVQKAKLVDPERSQNGMFGYHVAILGDYAIIGASNNHTDVNGNNPLAGSGAALVYHREANGQWVKVTKLVASDRKTGNSFGYSIAMNGNTAVIGSEYNSTDATGNNAVIAAGAAYVFERQPNGQWLQKVKLVANDRAANAYFGSSVAIDGNYIGVGSPFNATDLANGNSLKDAGAAYVFEKQNNQWVQVSKVIASDRAQGDRFGMSVGISGDKLAVGAPSAQLDVNGSNPLGDAGAAYIYQRQPNGLWSQTEKVQAADRTTYNFYGQTCAFVDQNLLVGAYYNSTNASNQQFQQGSGSVYYLTPAPIIVNQPPVVVNPIPNQAILMVPAYSFGIPAATFSDPEGQNLVLTITGLPAGLHQEGNFIEGTPTQSGTFPITVRATDPGGLWVDTTFMLTIGPNNPNPPSNPALQLVAPLYNCQTGAITFQTSGGDGSLIEFMAIGITGWTSNANQLVEAALRNDPTIAPLTLKARQNGVEISYIWNLLAYCQGGNQPPQQPESPSGQPLQLLAPTYNCLTGEITFHTMGGDGTEIGYMAVGITGWSKSPNQFVEAALRNDPTIAPFTLKARQGEVEVSYNWNLVAYCNSGARMASPEVSANRWQAVVLGNPVTGETVRVRVQGAQGQTVQIGLTDLAGRSLARKTVQVTQPEQDETIEIGPGPAGIYLLQVGNQQQAQSLKVLKQ